MLSVLGLILLNGCDDFLTLYLAIELQSLSFYILAVFQRNSEYNGEASLKYFILGSLASGFLLFGFALLYTAYGSFLFESVARISFNNENLLSLLGFSFIFITLLFKLGAFPFHQ
jgi:NADH-quinone oxidoreductase subunit N